MQGVVPGQDSTPAPSRRALATWSQTIQVTLRDMKTTDVVVAGVSNRPAHLSQAVLSGYSVGTWTAGNPLAPGDSYTVKVYTPEPSPTQLKAAGGDYAGLPAGYRSLLLPPEFLTGGNVSAQIVFPPFHSRAPVQNVIGSPRATGVSILQASPYAAAYGVARRLALAATTPYGFVMSVKQFLARGYVYNQNPPIRPYPLASFLFADKRGYCQQFAGAMALLLRMGGVPARVAVGFTQGRLDAATGRWLVTDIEAHAWVEVWFPHYGWVRFDPTPAADPALSASGPIIGATGGGLASGAGTGLKAAGGIASASRLRVVRGGSVRARGGFPVAAIAAPAGAVALALLALVFVLTRPLESVEAQVAELERALARSGRPLGAGATLARLEHTMRGLAGASGYVRALRLARFGSGHEPPTAAQRRALRRQLARGRGPLGVLRALWVLPPRRRRPRHGGRRTRTAVLPGA
jgi:hypothetical protein